MSRKGIACTNCQVRLKLSVAEVMAIMVPVIIIINTPVFDIFHWSIGMLLAAALAVLFGIITSLIFSMKIVE